MQTTIDIKSVSSAENDLQQVNPHRAELKEANLSNEILTDQLPPELLGAYRGMTQSSSLLYGVPNIWESSEVQYDPTRSVLDCVRRYNTPDKQRTQELAIAIHNICKDFATKPQVSVQDEGGEFLLKGLLYLQILIKSITATDFMLGLGGKAIIERGGERSKRKGELSAIVQKIQVSESSLDWTDLSNDERYLIAALCVFALKDINQTIIEEINRTVDPLHLPLELAKRLSIIEVNLKQGDCFQGSGSQLLASITRYPEFQTQMQQVCRVTLIHICQGLRKELFLPDEIIKVPDPSTLRMAADVLGISPSINLCQADQDTKRQIFTEVLQRLGSLDQAVARVMKLITNEFCDDFTVMQRTKNRPWQVGDTMIGFACILGVPWRVESYCAGVDPVKIKAGDLNMISVESNKAPHQIWQRRPEDLEDSLQDDDPQRLAVFRERQVCIRLEQKIKLEGVPLTSLSAEELNLLQLNAKRHQNRLWVYNQNAVSTGKHAASNVLNLIFNASFDATGDINNQPHAISGIQSGFRIPFGYAGNIRFWNEARRPECEMGLAHIPITTAYTMIIHELYQAAELNA